VRLLSITRFLVNASQFGAPKSYVTVRCGATEIARRHRDLIALAETADHAFTYTQALLPDFSTTSIRL
jgi:hypothetical protein